MLQKGCDTHLCGCGITSRVRYPRCSCNLRSIDQFRETIRPCIVKAVVGAKIHNDAFTAADFINGIDEWFAHTVRKGHDPTVNLTFLFHPAHIVWTEVFVGDLALVVAFELLAGEFAGGDMAKIHLRMLVENVDECLNKRCQVVIEHAGVTGHYLACVAASSNDSHRSRLRV